MAITAKPFLKTTFLRLLQRGSFFLLRLALPLILLGLAAHVTFQPDTHDDIRQADKLFMQQQFYHSLQQYTALAQHTPSTELSLRLGMLHTVRGEYATAESHLRQVLQANLSDEWHDLAVLYLSHVLRQQGYADDAMHTWARASATSSLTGVAHILQAEWQLHEEHYAAARQTYQIAMQHALPINWLPVVIYRVALLQAAQDSDAALAILEQPAHHLHLTTMPNNPFLAPLRPAIEHDAAQLLAILQADAPEQTLLLGKLYAHLHFYDLAKSQFAHLQTAATDATDAEAIILDDTDLHASTYTAYVQLQMGHVDEAQEHLEIVLETYPNNPQVRILLTLAYLLQKDSDAAGKQIAILTKRYPLQPDIYLSWANWYIYHHDYIHAREAYHHAMWLSPREERGRYALLAAQFHLETSYDVCDHGLPAANVAVQMLPNDATAWTMLAAMNYQCADFARAIEVAQKALDHGAGADAFYYLGASLARQGQHDAAYTALVQAADLAPDSIWRERAEYRLAWLP